MALPHPYCIRIIGSIVVIGEELSVKLDFILSPHNPAPISLTQQQPENLY